MLCTLLPKMLEVERLPFCATFYIRWWRWKVALMCYTFPKRVENREWP